METTPVKKRRPPHMNGTQVPGKETLTCEECKRRGVACGGVWRFHSQHGKYILQCRTCRLKKRARPFRKFENDDEPRASPKTQGGTNRVEKRRRASTPISITDSEEDDQEGAQVAGPSSHPEKKPKIKSADGWERLQDTLLAARKKKVEIETLAEIEVAKINSIIEEAQRDLKKAK